MSAQNNGGPAFPGKYVKHAPGEVGNNVAIMADGEGMTLRDYFASSVTASDLPSIRVKADREALAGRAQPNEVSHGLDAIRFDLEVEAALRYMFADAMLAAREAS